ncbi:transposase [Kaistella sp. DKR-2]|uniref:transposase n=1 Tax=Kaistella soli TaxID=2849654 RepID=UPI001C25A024|nr:transposase [Kaistella soli]MBU8882041.1 transposase [Kaistella soli]
MPMDLFKNKYRIPSARLQSWDYSRAGLYFITICTYNRAHFFGKITGGKMQLSALGGIVEAEWLKTFEIRKDMNLLMGEFVVMPDHFHAIIGIGDNDYNRTDAMHSIYAMHCVSMNPPNPPKNQFGPQSKNLASIIRGFKSSVTVAARRINPDFQWQPRFHDHIIRNIESYHRISQYIIDNPTKMG